MHPCPCVDEIVRLVAYVLVASKGKASAAALARCCKTLQEPVLDALWEHQEGLTPLLESLPGDVWNTEAYDVRSANAIRFSLYSNPYFHSLSEDFRRLWNGLASGYMREGFERSKNITPYRWKFTRPCSFVPSANLCSQV